MSAVAKKEIGLGTWVVASFVTTMVFITADTGPRTVAKIRARGVHGNVYVAT